MKKLLLLFVAGLIVMATAGCAGKSPGDKPADKTDPAPESAGARQETPPAASQPPEKAGAAWTAEVSGVVMLHDNEYYIEEENSGHLVWNKQLILRTFGIRAAVTAINVDTGDILWVHELWKHGFEPAMLNYIDYSCYAPWIILDGMLIHPLLHTASARIYIEKIDLSTGELLWRKPTDFDGAEFVPYPYHMEQAGGLLVASGSVLSSSGGKHGKLNTILSTDSGEVLYSIEGRTFCHGDSLYHVPGEFSDTSSAYRFARYDLPTGEKMWEAAIDIPVEPKTRYLGNFSVNNGVVLCQLHHKVLALNDKSGKLLWQKDGFRPAYTGRKILVLTGEKGALLLNMVTGEEIRWIEMAAPDAAAYNETLFLAGEGSLQALRLDTGELLWEKNLGGNLHVVRDKVLLSREERLLALDPDTGTPLWEKQLTNPSPNSHLWVPHPHALDVVWVSSGNMRPWEPFQSLLLSALDLDTGGSGHGA